MGDFMDYDKFIEILFKEFDKNPPLWIGAGSLLILLVAFLIFRILLKTGKKKSDYRNTVPAFVQDGDTAPRAELGTVMASLNDEPPATGHRVLSIDDTLDVPDISISTRDELGLLEELSIPRPGTSETVKPKPTEKDLSKELPKDPPPVDTGPASQSERTLDELQEIERKLIALRELHDAGLIATEIYLLKSREFARDL